jgi:hypothetical protein
MEHPKTIISVTDKLGFSRDRDGVKNTILSPRGNETQLFLFRIIRVVGENPSGWRACHSRVSCTSSFKGVLVACILISSPIRWRSQQIKTEVNTAIIVAAARAIVLTRRRLRIAGKPPTKPSVVISANGMATR